ncbi:MAG: hypothetical protein IKR82_00535 [Bacteroidales bacterium]|nr:hypothetical protein [Bacteroidales bacterium]
MAKVKNITRKFVNFFSGDFILNRKLDRHVWFMVYIFVLFSILITWSLTVESALVKVRKNEKTIEALNIARDQRSVELLSLDRRSTLEELLKKNHSTLKVPETPAVILEEK